MRLALPVLLVLAACASGRPRVALQLPLSGPVAADDRGNVFVVTPDNAARYDPVAHEIEDLLFDSVRLTAIAAVPAGPLLVLDGRRIDAVAPGRRIPLVELPGEGLLLAARRDVAYVAVSAGSDVDVLRYRFDAKRLEPFFRTADRPQALAAVPGGCLVAIGGGVHKVFDPHGGEIQRHLLFAISSPTITGLAADEGSETIFFSDGQASYAWKEGRVWPLFPVGGALAVGSHRVFIADAVHLQFLDLPLPAAPDVKELAEPPRPPPAYCYDARIVDRAATTLDGGGLALTFKIDNPTSVWLDRAEIRVIVRAPDDSAILDATLAVPCFVGPGRWRAQRVDVPASALAGRETKDVRIELLRARQASVDPDALELALKDPRWVDGKMIGTVELRNGGAKPVRVTSLEFSYEDDGGNLLAAPSLLPCDARLPVGETLVLEFRMLTLAEFEAMQAQRKMQTMRVWHGRVEPAE